jgi:hypothetical protein
MNGPLGGHCANVKGSHMKIRSGKNFILLIGYLCLSFLIHAQEKPAEDAQAIADKLSNPVANMISVPFQNNLDYGIGPNNGSKYTINFQPVIPISLGKKLNLITRYIIPIVDQHDITGDKTSTFGLSDATITAFFSPTNVKNGLIWGAGPAFLVPIGTDDLLSTRKWAVGPSALVLKQAKGLTYGFLMNQLWSFAGDENRNDVNQLFVQPFFAKNFKSGAGLGFNSEISIDWRTGNTTAFLNPIVTAITKLGTQIISMGIGPRIPLSAPSETKADFGLRAVLTFVFPK